MKQYLFGILFILGIFIIAIVNVFSPKQDISLSENRKLAMRPFLSSSSFLTSTFQKEYGAYVNDQFYQRDAMRQIKSTIDNCLGIKQIKDVFIGSDHLMQAQTPIKQEKIKHYAEAMNAFANAHENISMMSMVVPNKATVLQDKVLKFAPIHNQQEDLASLQKQLTSFQNIDVMQLFLENNDKDLYYKSDHHWTTLGAYIALQSFLETKKIQETMDYEPMIVNNRFYGTLANATGLNIYDDMYIYKPMRDDIKSVVNYVEEQKKTTSVYDMEKQYAPNPYDIFLSGNHALIEITTTSKHDRSILLIKDSYANSFIPFLLPYYHQITIVDPRYYYEDIGQLMRLRNVDEVLFLYNANTFFSDTSLLDVIKGT